MGAFANTLFRGLLGWVQTAAAGLWGLVTDTDMGAWMRWLLDNWLPLIILLCAGGIVVDFIVYLIRWQPYRVWGSFLRRLTEKDTPSDAEAKPRPALQRRWIYADGSTSVEDVFQPLQEPIPSERLEAPIRPVRRVIRRSASEKAYIQPVYPPQWQHTHEQGEHE